MLNFDTFVPLTEDFIDLYYVDELDVYIDLSTVVNEEYEND